jgi:hypothetical protein
VPPKFPRTVLLMSGREAKVLDVAYQYGRTTWRIAYEEPKSELGKRGCIAEWMPDRFEEVEKPTPIRYTNG